MSDPSTLAALLLVNRLVPGLRAEPLRAKEYWALLRQVDDPGELLGKSAEEIAARAGLQPGLSDRVAELLSAGTALAFELEQLNRSGISLLSSLDERFPARLRDRLGDSCPGALLVAGNLDWLSQGGLGVVGSREAEAAARDTARDAGRLAARNGWPLISGVARGIDRDAMGGAIEREGRVTGVPTEGLRRVMRSAEVRRAVHEEKLCLLSPYAPDTGFTVGNAMARNRFIYALADLTLVVCSEHDSGGTWAGAKEALKHGFGQVAAWTGPGAGPGNEVLVNMGATPIEGLDKIELKAASAGTAEAPVQLEFRV